jgi:hypothetical protein
MTQVDGERQSNRGGGGCVHNVFHRTVHSVGRNMIMNRLQMTEISLEESRPKKLQYVMVGYYYSWTLLLINSLALDFVTQLIVSNVTTSTITSAVPYIHY